MEPNETGKSRAERIARMQAEGVLTPSQARLLLASLSSGPPPEGQTPGRSRAWGKWPLYLGLGMTAVFFAAMLAVGGGGGAIQDVSQTINQPGGMGEMNKTLSNFLAVVLILAVPIGLWAWLHNSIVAKEEAVYSSWAQVESSYQRRSDLIPRLVETVSRYMKHEAETLRQVTDSRAGSGDLAALVEELVQAQKASADLLLKGGKIVEDAGALAALQQAQMRVGGGMRRMFALVESYPQLRSSDQFLELQGQLEGTENRINVARINFNEAVEAYNQSIRKLPGSLVAGAGGFQRKAYFQADEGSRNAQKLDFH